MGRVRYGHPPHRAAGRLRAHARIDTRNSHPHAAHTPQPVFSLPDATGHEVDWAAEVLKAPPAHAAPIEVQGGKSWRREVAAAQQQGKEPGRVNAGSGGGQLTELGWTQGEALGRRLRAIYGAPDLARLEVVSTDMPRV